MWITFYVLSTLMSTFHLAYVDLFLFRHDLIILIIILNDIQQNMSYKGHISGLVLMKALLSLFDGQNTAVDHTYWPVRYTGVTFDPDGHTFCKHTGLGVTIALQWSFDWCHLSMASSAWVPAINLTGLWCFMEESMRAYSYII